MNMQETLPSRHAVQSAWDELDLLCQLYPNGFNRETMRVGCHKLSFDFVVRTLTAMCATQTLRAIGED